MLSRSLYSIYQKRNKQVLYLLNKMEMHQWNSPQDILRTQTKQLENTLDLCLNSIPFYMERVSRHIPKKTTAIELINSFPVLTKEDIVDNFEALINPHYAGKSFKNYSGGSTGIPVTVMQDENRNIHNQAATMLRDQWAGWHFGSPVFRFWGASRDLVSKRKEIIKRILFKQYIFDSFNWTEETIYNIHKRINRVQPEVIISYASSIYLYVQMARELLLKNVHVPQGIVTSADMLYKYQRDAIEHYFNCKVFNRYGCREVGLIGSECEDHDGLHLSADRLFVEVVDSNNNPVPNGSLGKILITDLRNKVMPLVRYEIGDMGILSKQDGCRCGRGLPKLEAMEGRTTDHIVTPKGTFINGAALSTLVPKFKNIRRLQIVQNIKTAVVIIVERKAGYCETDEAELKHEFSRYLGGEIKIDIEYSDQVVNPFSGKYRLVVNNVDNDSSRID